MEYRPAELNKIAITLKRLDSYSSLRDDMLLALARCEAGSFYSIL